MLPTQAEMHSAIPGVKARKIGVILVNNLEILKFDFWRIKI
jgi:hypothetical protein